MIVRLRNNKQNYHYYWKARSIENAHNEKEAIELLALDTTKKELAAMAELFEDCDWLRKTKKEIAKAIVNFIRIENYSLAF